MTQLVNALINISNKVIKKSILWYFKLILISVIEHDSLIEVGKDKDNCTLNFTDSNHRIINVSWQEKDMQNNKSDIKSDKNKMKEKIEWIYITLNLNQ